MKANIKNLSFLIASYSEMVNTFGYSVQTNEFFEKQIKALKNISQIKSSDIFYINRVIGLNKYKEPEVIARITDFNSIMTQMLSVEKEAYESEFYKMYYNNQHNKEILRTVGDIFEINMQRNIKNIKPAIKFGSFSVSNKDVLNDYDKLKAFIEKNFSDKNIYLLKTIKVECENPNYTGCSGSFPHLYNCFDYSDLKDKEGIKELINKIAKSCNVKIYTVESDGCHPHEYIDTKLTKEFHNLDIDYNKLYNELDSLDTNYDRD